MTEQEILQQMDELQIKLDEIRAGRAAFSVNSSLTEAEKEKQHQEDLQRLRGLRLIDDDFMNACFDGYTDGEHIIYVNGVDRDASTELGKLIHDFFCTDPNDMHYKELADKVRYFKEDEEWRPCVRLWKI